MGGTKRRKTSIGTFEMKKETPKKKVFGPEYLQNEAGLTKTRFIPLIVARDVGFYRPDVFDERGSYCMGQFASTGWEIALGHTEALNSGTDGQNRWDWPKCFNEFTKLAKVYGFISLWKTIQGPAFEWNVQVFEHQCCEYRKCVRPTK